MSRPPKPYAVRLQITDSNHQIVIDTHAEAGPDQFAATPEHVVWGIAGVADHVAGLLQSWCAARTGECPREILRQSLHDRLNTLRTRMSIGQGSAHWRGGFQTFDGVFAWRAFVTVHVPADATPPRPDKAPEAVRLFVRRLDGSTYTIGESDPVAAKEVQA